MAKYQQFLNLYHTNREEFLRIVRYLVVGGWNTLFGVAVYAALFGIFSKWLGLKIMIMEKDYLYLVLAVPSNILAVTNAYICYKIFVFRTKGNIVREYFRCYLVYGTSMLLGMGGLYVLVTWLKFNPVAANILLTGITVVISYFGHKFFSFRKKENDKSV